MPICGFLIASLGWESVFYVTGAIGIIWSVAWFLLVFDSPSQHPRISTEERRYIEDSIGTTATTKVMIDTAHLMFNLVYRNLFSTSLLTLLSFLINFHYAENKETTIEHVKTRELHV